MEVWLMVTRTAARRNEQSDSSADMSMVPRSYTDALRYLCERSIIWGCIFLVSTSPLKIEHMWNAYREERLT